MIDTPLPPFDPPARGPATDLSAGTGGRAGSLPGDEPASWRWLHAAVGLEAFGRPAGPWGAVFAPVPLAAAGLLIAKWLLWPMGSLPWLADRAGEALYLLIAPFVLATLAHAACQAASEAAWRATEGRRQLDWSPRRWHYFVALFLAAQPLWVLQTSGWALDRYLDVSLWVRSVVGSMASGHVGYDPSLANLVTLAVFPLVAWQAGRIVSAVPPGRLLGLQRELARLRGALAWGPEAWGLAVGEAVDRWLADVAPRDGEAPLAGEGRRRHRQRWSALRRELVAAWVVEIPDLARANRALHLYRKHR